MSSVDIHRKPSGRWRSAGARAAALAAAPLTARATRPTSATTSAAACNAPASHLNAGRQPLWQFMEEWWRL